MVKHQVIIDPDKCVGCGICAKACAAHNIVIGNKRAKIRMDDCVMCGHCTAVCPKNAVTISGYDTEQIEKKEKVRLNPSDVLDVIRFRRRIRHFQRKDVPAEVIGQILEAGRLTHTAKNMQDVSFVVLEKVQTV